MATLSPGPHAELGQRVGGPAHLGQQVGIGDGPGVARLALPVEGHPVAPAGLDVAVDAVDGHVERAAHEPLGEGQVPLERRSTTVGPTRDRGPGPPRTRCGPRPPRRRCRPGRWPPRPAPRAAGRCGSRAAGPTGPPPGSRSLGPPHSLASLIGPPRWRPTSLATPAYQNGRPRSPVRRWPELEPLEGEGRDDGGANEGVAAQGTGRLPDTVLDHGLRPLPRLHLRTEDEGVGPPVVPSLQLPKVSSCETVGYGRGAYGTPPGPRKGLSPPIDRAALVRRRSRSSFRPASRTGW